MDDLTITITVTAEEKAACDFYNVDMASEVRQAANIRFAPVIAKYQQYLALEAQKTDSEKALEFYAKYKDTIKE